MEISGISSNVSSHEDSYLYGNKWDFRCTVSLTPGWPLIAAFNSKRVGVMYPLSLVP